MKRTIGIVVLLLTVSVFLFGQDKEQIMSLLYDIDEARTKYGDEITFIEEFNFGIPGGANWLVEWEIDGTHVATVMYVVDIDNMEIKFRDQIILRRIKNASPSFRSYYESFPGVTRGDGAYQVGDFNGDGFDKVLIFVAGNPGPTFDILGMNIPLQYLSEGVWGYDLIINTETQKKVIYDRDGKQV